MERIFADRRMERKGVCDDVTMNRVIEYVDRVKLNTYSDEEKYQWMKTLEEMIAKEVMGLEDAKHWIPEDGDKPLLVPAPYDEIYGLYVMAMIDFYNQEYGNYNNMTALFRQRLEQFQAWYIRQNRPDGAKNFRNVMG